MISWLLKTCATLTILENTLKCLNFSLDRLGKIKMCTVIVKKKLSSHLLAGTFVITWYVSLGSVRKCHYP